ncbi:hypothetical protein EVAR_60352_1 [Eumeta japonica]|uniref:Uncharacterized protein n=1 Tax=Eumeta variegata TaxID=151549 RepID=A0A4C1ZRC2_EUMVA|nr:hypothetical protein EVAR_60352_1 [Eumeta japonica]
MLPVSRWRVVSSDSSCSSCSRFTAVAPSRFPDDPSKVEVAHNSPEVEVALRLLGSLGANFVSLVPCSVAHRRSRESSSVEFPFWAILAVSCRSSCRLQDLLGNFL